MSLKQFHIIFIVIATLSVFFLSAWCIKQPQYQVIGIASGILGVGLIAYAMWFLKKTKNLNGGGAS